ncbi:OLC1v1002789C1 [Oldenlandia corymbosa var. corymbosa]|uniref:OLC1v1002789C1 n=1 Tax=Oldenlandia corymbosa var. corymbosa TaxID=529605 RepID=A0AAV1D8J1_OLDCO|nr:OLC1v1002789C1 [Oldenlandia corymbosa var. corymbosa]
MSPPRRRQRRISQISDESWMEILSYLPAKHLMRFKSVCRKWRSIIVDPGSVRLHSQRGAGKGVLVCGTYQSPRTIMDFYHISLDGQRISHHEAVFPCSNDDDKLVGCTNQVNGLVSFFCGNVSYLYNLANREILRLPDADNDRDTWAYHLGFDPVNKLYKLLRCEFADITPICPPRPIYYPEDGDEGLVFSTGYGEGGPYEGETYVRSSCEILTFGQGADSPELRWRVIDSSPPTPTRSLLPRIVCYDGVLYWKWDNNTHLHAFDLSTETFFDIHIPASGEVVNCIPELLRFGPCLSLSTSSCNRDGKLYWKIISLYYKKDGNHGDRVLDLLEPSAELRFEAPLNEARQMSRQMYGYCSS